MGKTWRCDENLAARRRQGVLSRGHSLHIHSRPIETAFAELFSARRAQQANAVTQQPVFAPGEEGQAPFGSCVPRRN
jgi:hypothetical protein